MQTMNFNVGTDHRGLVADVQNFKIGNDAKNWIQARQFEGEMRTVVVNVMEGTIPLNLTGTTIWFEGLMSDGKTRIIDAKHGTVLSPSTGQFRFEFPYAAFATFGSYKQSFFKIVRDGKSIATLEFTLDVLVNLVEDGIVPLDYITPFQDLYAKLEVIYYNADADIQVMVTKWQQQITELITGLNADYASIQTTVNGLNEKLDSIAKKIEDGGLLTQADFSPLQNEVEVARGGRATLGDRLAKIDKFGLTKMYFPKIERYQEDCALLNLADKWIIIDTGDDRDWNNIKNFITKYTDRIDIGIISHYHEDHAGNAVNLIKDADVDTTKMIWYLPPVPTKIVPETEIEQYTKIMNDIITVSGSNVDVVCSDLEIKLDSKTSIQFFNTSEESLNYYYSIENLAYNDFSMLTLITYNNTKLLFAGDVQTSIGKGGIYWIQKHYPQFIQPVDFLKINHHAYDNGIQTNFYIKLNPRYAIAMLTEKNMSPAPGHGGGGESSTAINVLDSLGTKISYAYETPSSFSISESGIKAIDASYKMRGTWFATEIQYYVSKSGDSTYYDGTEEHPFPSVERAIANIRNVPNITYNVHFLDGNYDELSVSNIWNHIIFSIEENVTFGRITIASCKSVDFYGDVHVTSTIDRAVHINSSVVTFGKKLMADSYEGLDKTLIDSSRFLTVYSSNVSVADLVCIGHSLAAGAYGASNLSIIKAEGISGTINNNLFGVYAQFGDLHIGNLNYLPADTLRSEDSGGRVLFDIAWTTLATLNGIVAEPTEPVQFRVKGNKVDFRGSISSPNIDKNVWINVVQLPGIARPQDNYLYRSTSISSNNIAVPTVLENGILKIKISESIDNLGFNLSFPIY